MDQYHSARREVRQVSQLRRMEEGKGRSSTLTARAQVAAGFRCCRDVCRPRSMLCRSRARCTGARALLGAWRAAHPHREEPSGTCTPTSRAGDVGCCGQAAPAAAETFGEVYDFLMARLPAYYLERPASETGAFDGLNDSIVVCRLTERAAGAADVPDRYRRAQVGRLPRPTPESHLFERALLRTDLPYCRINEAFMSRQLRFVSPTLLINPA